MGDSRQIKKEKMICRYLSKIVLSVKKTAYEVIIRLVGSEMYIRDS